MRASRASDALWRASISASRVAAAAVLPHALALDQSGDERAQAGLEAVARDDVAVGAGSERFGRVFRPPRFEDQHEGDLGTAAPDLLDERAASSGMHGGVEDDDRPFAVRVQPVERRCGGAGPRHREVGGHPAQRAGREFSAATVVCDVQNFHDGVRRVAIGRWPPQLQCASATRGTRGWGSPHYTEGPGVLRRPNVGDPTFEALPLTAELAVDSRPQPL